MPELIFLTIKAVILVLILLIGRYAAAKIIIQHLKGMGVEINETLEGKIKCLTRYVLLIFVGVWFLLYFVLSLQHIPFL